METRSPSTAMPDAWHGFWQYEEQPGWGCQTLAGFGKTEFDSRPRVIFFFRVILVSGP